MDLIMKYAALLINALVCGYWLLMDMEYAVKLLTFVNEIFLQ